MVITGAWTYYLVQKKNQKKLFDPLEDAIDLYYGMPFGPKVCRIVNNFDSLSVSIPSTEGPTLY